ncbi:MAG: MBL fold metallo-hydrolase [Planctomycetes bacterium]|nr:MBL fold metallo-hydrolase [Planctomycetota bacterium]
MVRLWSVLGNSQKLDGGAMFGNAPKALWQRWAPADEQNRIDLACRCLVVRDGARVVLCEAGIGAFFAPELRRRFGVQEERHVLLEQLAAIGIQPADVDVVVLSHLHFDHAGGVLSAFRDGAPLGLVFPNAHYVVGEAAWQRALRPHPRDRASFVPELPGLLERTGRLERLTGERSTVLGAGYRFHRSDGHTPGMLLCEVAAPGGPLLFCADLIPGVPWVRRAITMGYDRFPEQLIDEKTALLADLHDRGGRLFFTHDPATAVCRLGRDEASAVVAVEPVTALAGDE